MKNYLVIGGSSGIGKALVEQLCEQGHNVYSTYNSTQPEERNGVSFQKFNVEDEPNFDFLPDTLDGLVYCPGRINLLPFSRLKPDAIAEDFNIQVLGAVKSIQACLPKLKNAQEASIVLFSTVAVQQGFNFHSLVSMSKGAIEGLTRSLAAELSPSIRVNAIAPSITDTPLASKLLSTEEKKQANAERHPLKKIGQANDIANMAEFLLSPKSAWVTGQILAVDGGMSSIKL